MGGSIPSSSRHFKIKKLYLTYNTNTAKVVSFFAFLPQMLLILLASLIFYSDLSFCIILITMIFVHFNKVITAQYFLWYISLIPLLIHRNDLFKQKKGLITFTVWIILELVWNFYAHRLEQLGINSFIELYIIEVLFFITSCYLISLLIKYHKSDYKEDKLLSKIAINNKLN